MIPNIEDKNLLKNATINQFKLGKGNFTILPEYSRNYKTKKNGLS